MNGQRPSRTSISSNLRDARFDLRRRWRLILDGPSVDHGNWETVLKRTYGYAIKADMADMESRALSDLIEFPGLDERIFEYFARRN